MKGITHLSSYIPRFRIPKKIIQDSWSLRGSSGSVSIANYDEDVLTMAIESATSSHFPKEVDSVFLATTSSPFVEESTAALAAYILEYGSDCKAQDINQSLTSGLEAIFRSLESDDKHSIIIAADRRQVESGDTFETKIGEAASTISIGEGNVLFEIEAHGALYDFGYDSWKLSKHSFIHHVDDKFSEEVRITLYKNITANILNKAGISIKEIDHLIVADREVKIVNKVSRTLNFINKNNEKSRVYDEIGYTGVSMPFLLLNEKIKDINPGERVLILQSGSGAKGILLKATNYIEEFKKDDTFHEQLDNTSTITSYQETLLKRGNAIRNGLKPYSTLTYLRRERANNLLLHAQKCLVCETIHFPKQQLCRECKAKLVEPNYSLSKNGKIFTFTIDYVFPGEDPTMIMTVVDLENGGRLFTQLTDSNEPDIGMSVKLSLRKIHEGADYPNYFWKAIPL